MHGSVPGLLDQCVRLTIGTPEENQRCFAALSESIADLV
jgi:histidinol-phosphate/aromatic aminotransferase/cobyric acid decarboxylase-like protein